MLEFKKPIPVITPLGGGYAIYVSDLENGGDILHFRSDQIKIYKNATFDITEKKD
jgi:hypothetical protein